MTLAELARAVLRLRDSEADFELQALCGIRPSHSGSRAAGSGWLLRVLGAGGGELGWEESGFRGTLIASFHSSPKGSTSSPSAITEETAGDPQ